ncbi:MAG: c-type cytochrome [Woeseiaceae bacterium]|nr:c-type cytochrome [Woeseiaceae bacterium]
MLLGLVAAARAEGPTYGLGSTPAPAEIDALDTLVDQDGALLPAGSGAPAEGAILFAQRCAMCHGADGEGTDTAAGVGPMLIAPGKQGTKGIRHLHFATTLFSFIHRAMPMHQERTLTVDQAYALTAFLLWRNGIIDEDEQMNAESLRDVVMPNRDAWQPPPETSG